MIPRGYTKHVSGLTFAPHLAPGMPTTGGSVRSAGLPLRQARLCLDCDCLTDEQSCPWCDRQDTIPLSGWFHPIEDAKDNAARHEKTTAVVPRRWILVVQHHQRDLHRVLRQALAGTGVEVVYERRVGQRRRTAAGRQDGERRGPDRRRPRPSAAVYQDLAAPSKPETPSRPSVSRETTEVARPRRRQPASV